MTASIPRHTQGQRVGGLRYSTKVTADTTYALKNRHLAEYDLGKNTREHRSFDFERRAGGMAYALHPGIGDFFGRMQSLSIGVAPEYTTARGRTARYFTGKQQEEGRSNINEFQTLRRERRGRSRFSHFRENGEPLRGLAVGRKDPGISCQSVRDRESQGAGHVGEWTKNTVESNVCYKSECKIQLTRRHTGDTRSILPQLGIRPERGVIHGLSGGWYLQRKHQVRVSKIAGYGKAFAREPQNARQHRKKKREDDRVGVRPRTGKIGVVHALDLFKVVDQDDGDVYWGALSVGFGRAVGRRTARASHRCHLLSPTTTSSFLVRSTHLGMTQDTLEDLYDKLSCKTGTGCAAQRRRTEYTIFVWRQQQPPSDTTSTSSAVASSVDQTIWRRHGQSTFGSPGICTLNPGNSLENTAFRASLLWDVIQLFLDERRTSLPLLRLYGRMPIQTLSRAAVLLVAAFMLPSSGLDLSVRVARSGFFESHFKKTGGELNVLAGKGGGRAKPPK
ncbi:hypothetical protein FB45DRAFT_876630 [Roridomyces roridus]|uniref:Uncharacterized protein n=1 Tax=Roridomyces roridus TaxID=1738132 RepID=A0AAD7B4G5_9AGAR|nr:hypothetical protein FB45DRAFT_876630 [Roridomyces roridus]